VTRPEDALEQARAEAERRRAEGGYAGDTQAGPAPLDAARVTPELLREWSLIEVDPELLYSTRRGGAPITAVKRALLRLLRQYTTELEAQQTRFNVGALGYIRELEERLAELERRGPE
jgi:hypothetical protein